jgi:hypothetical protein
MLAQFEVGGSLRLRTAPSAALGDQEQREKGKGELGYRSASLEERHAGA